VQKVKFIETEEFQVIVREVNENGDLIEVNSLVIQNKI
jgi:hypothetical protein